MLKFDNQTPYIFIKMAIALRQQHFLRKSFESEKKMTETTKNFIDRMTYEEMLKLWRFSPPGSMIFQGETGDYFSKVMKEKKKKVNAAEISKKIGW